MSLEDLIIRLLIKEDNLSFDRKTLNPLNANVKMCSIVHAKASKTRARTKTEASLGQLVMSQSRRKFQTKCFNYDKQG